jgi:hypothetical protein
LATSISALPSVESVCALLNMLVIRLPNQLDEYQVPENNHSRSIVSDGRGGTDTNENAKQRDYHRDGCDDCGDDVEERGVLFADVLLALHRFQSSAVLKTELVELKVKSARVESESAQANALLYQ